VQRLLRIQVCCLLILVILTFVVIPPTFIKGAPGVPLKEKFQQQMDEGTIEFDDDVTGKPYYADIKATYVEKGYKPVENIEVVLEPKDIIASDKGEIPLASGIGGNDQPVLVWEADYSWFEWSVDIPQSGLYEIAIEYYPLPASGSPIQRELRIDGQVPFVEAYNITLYRFWKDESKPKVNNIGDEVRPRQVEINKWRTVTLSDNQGMYSEPFQFYFTKGKHTLRLDYVDQPVAIGRIFLRAPEEMLSYQGILSIYKDKGYKPTGKTVKIQAEECAIEKNDPTIRREGSNDPLAEPTSPTRRLLNVIGDWRWRKGGQSITWEFEVPEDGLYKIGLRVGQWWGDGLSSYRSIFIDGKIPFEEMKEYEFKYQNGWRTEILKDSNGEPYLFYLTKGKHTLTMKVVMGPLTEVIHDLTDNALLISDIIRRIIMITGNEPDPNYEYELDRRIPGLLDDLQYIADSMQRQIDRLERMSVKRGSMINNFATIKSQMESMVANPDKIPVQLNDLNNAQTSISSWINSLKNRPLAIDYFLIGSPEEKWPNARANAIQKLYYMFMDFIASFYKDYDSVGNVYQSADEEGTLINVWVGRGKEWAEIIKEMADEEFTPRTGVYVNINVVPPSQLGAGATNALMLAITANRAPDVALGVDANSPVEFAIREAVVNLKQFDNFEEVSKRFLPGIMVPFEYRGGVYALPETMNFQVLFYRKDILKELGIKIPDTWDELYTDVLPVLYQNGLEFGYPTGNPTANFSPFLYQHGGEFYKENGMKSGLDTPEAYLAFKEYTELYTSYGVPVVADLFNRMRNGEMPLCVGGYDLYMRLSTAAPELFGRWGIALIPGKKKDDSTIDRSTGGIAGQAAIILSQSKHKEEAWKFLDWWTDTDTQVRFGREVEALLGVEARWNTANVEAFEGLPWKIQDLRVIQESWKWYKEQPVVLGGYFTARHINNAWNRVVLGEMNVRDSLELAVKEINKELRAKQEEYGVVGE
jgi:ABC-type glycerol-3-phosphate transport system substrate-binding protein